MRNKVRELQRALYRAAKTDRGRCFHSLFDKVWRSDRLRKALRYRSKKKGVGRYRDLPNSILYRRYGLAGVGMGRIRYCTS